jgi:hypothetical protein
VASTRRRSTRKLTVTIEFEGAILRDSDFPQYEAARLLRKAASLVEEHVTDTAPPEEWGLLDLNGGKVGKVVFL